MKVAQPVLPRNVAGIARRRGHPAIERLSHLADDETLALGGCDQTIKIQPIPRLLLPRWSRVAIENAAPGILVEGDTIHAGGRSVRDRGSGEGADKPRAHGFH